MGGSCKTPGVDVLFGLGLLLTSIAYGYCLAVQPQVATSGARRIADWTYRQPVLLRLAVASVVWLSFMTGVMLFARGTG
jgi:hypothetical protein